MIKPLAVTLAFACAFDFFRFAAMTAPYELSRPCASTSAGQKTIRSVHSFVRISPNAADLNCVKGDDHSAIEGEVSRSP